MNMHEQKNYITKRRAEDETNFFVFFNETGESSSLDIHYLLNEEEWHFRVVKGHSIEPPDEDILTMILLLDNIHFEIDPKCEFNILQAAISWGLNYIGNSSPQMLLLRLYYGFCTRTCYEKLAKTDLTFVFKALLQAEIVETKTDGRSILQILNLPSNILRLFNSSHGVSYLKTYGQRQFVMQLFKKYHYLLNREEPLTEEEVEYLVTSFKYDRKVTKETFAELTPFTEKEQRMLEEYAENYKQVLEYYPALPHPKCVAPKDLERYISIQRIIKGLEKNEDMLDALLSERLSNHGLIGGKVLRTVREFTYHSAVFANCLFRYPVQISLSEVDTVVVVLHESICIELRKSAGVYILVQALGKYNRGLDGDEDLKKVWSFCNMNNIIP